MEYLSLSVKKAIDAAQTDSDVLDIAEAHNVDAVACFDYVCRRDAKERCKTCRHVGLFASMFPCNACSGISDYYEAEANE